MISKRRAVQMGLIAAVAVFVTSIGVLITQGGDNALPPDHQPQSIQSKTQQTPSVPISLSSLATSSASRADAAQH